MKLELGPEYPQAASWRGMRMPLHRETRWTRYFRAEDGTGLVISRFMDGSASTTLSEVQREWPAWSEDEREDFCDAASHLHGQPNVADILRFILDVGTHAEVSCVALAVAAELPQDEAFSKLLSALRATPVGHASNISQGLAATKHPEAQPALRDHLDEIWKHPDLYKSDESLNWVAFDATTCINHLLELGAPAEEFEQQTRSLSEHACSSSRDSCRRFLGKYYEWLSERAEQQDRADAKERRGSS